MFNFIKSIPVLAAVGNPNKPSNYQDIVTIIVDLLSLLLPVLVGLGVLLFFWGLVSFLTAQGSEESVSIAKKRMFWGVIVLFVMTSAWAIVGFFYSDFFGGDANRPILPVYQNLTQEYNYA